MPVRLPPAAPGQRIGLYGGSFNPAHAGHLHVARIALRRLALDRLWWLVSPANPLKDKRELAPLAERVEGARQVARDPRVAISGFETEIRARYTIESLRFLRARHPSVRFVWIMGADSLAGFHEIAGLMPIAVIDRPGYTLAAPSAPAARALGRYRIDESDAGLLAGLPPPAWIFLHGPRSSLSSTELRKHG